MQLISLMTDFDSGQLSSASATTGPRTHEPGGLGRGRSESGDLLSERDGPERVGKKAENSSLDMVCNILR